MSSRCELEFIFGLNTPAVDGSALEGSCRRHGFRGECVEAFSQSLEASVNHGRCLDVLLGKMRSSCGMFIDCDIAFLMKDWDVKMRSELKGGVAVIGPEYDGKKYKQFPNVIACMFLTDALKKSGVGFVPDIVEPFGPLRPLLRYLPLFGSRLQKDRLRRIRVGSHNRDLFGRECGDEIVLDVGWELPVKLKRNGYGGCALPLVRADDPGARFTASGIRGEEHFLGDEPVFAHVGRSSTRDFEKDPIVIAWRAAVEAWLSRSGL